MNRGHPAIIKAKHIARVAAENDWKGKIEFNAAEAITTLDMQRNDEEICASWTGQKLDSATYSIFDHTAQLTCSKHVLKKVTGWPDLADLFHWFPNMNRPNLVRTYRKLPFDWENDPPEDIIAKLIGCQIFWYSHISAKMYCDVVLPPKRGKTHEIRQIGHRRMFNFIGAQAGFRSVLLDSLVKVA